MPCAPNNPPSFLQAPRKNSLILIVFPALTRTFPPYFRFFFRFGRRPALPATKHALRLATPPRRFHSEGNDFTSQKGLRGAISFLSAEDIPPFFPLTTCLPLEGVLSTSHIRTNSVFPTLSGDGKFPKTSPPLSCLLTLWTFLLFLLIAFFFFRTLFYGHGPLPTL